MLVLILTLYCFASASDVVRHVVVNRVSEMPPDRALQNVFYAVTFPAVVGQFALLIYAFVVLPWWQPFVGLAVALLLVVNVTRRFLAGRGWLYVWAMAFSLAGVAVLAANGGLAIDI